MFAIIDRGMLLRIDEKHLRLESSDFDKKDETGSDIDGCCCWRCLDAPQLCPLDDEKPYKFEDDRTRAPLIRLDSSPSAIFLLAENIVRYS
jgi:hypothetical protein